MNKQPRASCPLPCGARHGKSLHVEATKEVVCDMGECDETPVQGSISNIYSQPPQVQAEDPNVYPQLNSIFNSEGG